MPKEKKATPAPEAKEKTAKAAVPASAAEMDEETKNAKSLADLAGTGGGMFDGESVSFESLKDQKVTVMDFRLMPSTFREGGTYACLQIRLASGKVVVTNTNALVIVKGLANVNKADLPAPVTFFMQQGKDASRKPYWNMR